MINPDFIKEDGKVELEDDILVEEKDENFKSTTINASGSINIQHDQHRKAK